MEKFYMDILKTISDPLLILVGLVVLIFLGLVKSIINKGLISQLSKKDSGHTIGKAINYMFAIVIAVIIMSFGTYLIQMTVKHEKKEIPNFQLKEMN